MADAKAIDALPRLLEQLHATYPEARYELNWENPLQLLIATLLAAQCTDERVNQVTATLFPRYPDAGAFAEADPEELAEVLKPTGFYRQKAQVVQAVCRALLERHGGTVPASMDALVALPGVARKTANVVLTTAFELPSGVIVDTHVQRVSRRLGLSEQTRPEKIERDLMVGVPEEEWTFLGPALVLHGRYVCTARTPRCADCVLRDLCPRHDLEDTPDPDPSPPQDAAGEGLPLEDAPAMATKKPAANGKKKTPPASTGKKKTAPSAAGKKTPAPPPPRRPAKAAAPAPVMASASSIVPPPPLSTEPTRLETLLPADWRAALAGEVARPSFRALDRFLAGERQDALVTPDEGDVFAAFHQTPLDTVRVVLFGQEPSCAQGVADGLAFSAREGVDPSETQRALFRELRRDLGCRIPVTGSLRFWARQGVLLLNSVLTVRVGNPGAHRERGWETFTDGVLRLLAARPDPIVFVLFGPAAKKRSLLGTDRHVVLTAEHPGIAPDAFLGSDLFSTVNTSLELNGRSAIYWQLQYV